MIAKRRFLSSSQVDKVDKMDKMDKMNNTRRPMPTNKVEYLEMPLEMPYDLRPIALQMRLSTALQGLTTRGHRFFKQGMHNENNKGGVLREQGVKKREKKETLEDSGCN
jgi:hypothetical protein